MQSRLIRLIGVVFSNGTVLSVSDKYDSVNECNQEISKLMKLHIQGVWQNAHKFIRYWGLLWLYFSASVRRGLFLCYSCGFWVQAFFSLSVAVQVIVSKDSLLLSGALNLTY